MDPEQVLDQIGLKLSREMDVLEQEMMAFRKRRAQLERAITEKRWLDLNNVLSKDEIRCLAENEPDSLWDWIVSED